MRGRDRARILIGTAAIFAVLLHGTALRADEPQPNADPNVIVEFDVAHGGDVILVPVEFGSQKYQFLVDTGCSICAIDRSLLGLVKEIKGQGTGRDTQGASIQTDYCYLPDGKIGPMEFSPEGPVAIVDLAGVEVICGYHIHGIVGLNYLVNRVVRFDFDNGKLAFLKSANASADCVVPIRIEDADFRIECWIGGASRRFTIDTGMFGSDQLSEALLPELL